MTCYPEVVEIFKAEALSKGGLYVLWAAFRSVGERSRLFCDACLSRQEAGHCRPLADRRHRNLKSETSLPAYIGKRYDPSD